VVPVCAEEMNLVKQLGKTAQRTQPGVHRQCTMAIHNGKYKLMRQIIMPSNKNDSGTLVWQLCMPNSPRCTVAVCNVTELICLNHFFNLCGDQFSNLLFKLLLNCSSLNTTTIRTHTLPCNGEFIGLVVLQLATCFGS
jgi:hypothetical protein